MSRLLVLPAAGRSVRMGGLLKELLPVGGRPTGDADGGLAPIPVLRHALELGLAVRADRAVVVTSSVKAHALMDAIAAFALPLHVAYVHQREPIGLADALLCAEPLMADDDATLMLMPDTVVRPAAALEQALERVERGATVAVTLHAVEEPERFGVAELAGGRVAGFVDKPRHASGPWVWTSVAFRPRFLECVRAARRPGAEWALTEALDLAARRASLEAVFVANGSFADVGTYQGYLAALAQIEPPGVDGAMHALASDGAP